MIGGLPPGIGQAIGETVFHILGAFTLLVALTIGLWVSVWCCPVSWLRPLRIAAWMSTGCVVIGVAVAGWVISRM